MLLKATPEMQRRGEKSRRILAQRHVEKLEDSEGKKGKGRSVRLAIVVKIRNCSSKLLPASESVAVIALTRVVQKEK
jgi:hypothetical protein